MLNPQPAETASSPPVGLRSKTQAEHLFTGVLCVLVLSLFMGFIFNRYLPINEGWFHYYSWLMHQGKIPYRDFWFFGPPLSLSWAWLFAGDQIINLRLFGLVERIILSGMLYFLLSRQFSPRASFMATVVSMLVFLSYLSEGFFTYLVDSFFFMVAGLIGFHQSQAHPRHGKLLIFATGALVSLSFFSKQSTGLFATLAVGILIVWLGTSAAQTIWTLLYFSAGWCMIGFPITGWLVMHGAWQPFLEQVFKGAASSKGTLKTVLFTSLLRSVSPNAAAIVMLLLGALGLAVWRKRLIPQSPQNTNISRTGIVITALLFLTAIFLPFFFPVDDSARAHMRRYVTLLAKVIFIIMGLSLAWITARRLRSRTDENERVTVILVVAGFLWAYGCLMSYMVEQHAIVLGLAFLVAVTCDKLSFSSGHSVFAAVTILCLLQSGEIAWYKYNYAYDWNGWHSNLGHVTASSRHPALAGYQLDPYTIEMYETIIDDINRVARPGEPIFTFPHMPLFNFITRRPQPTFAAVHYWDVCPDYLAEADAVRVAAAKPSVIIVMEMSRWLWLDGEKTFRLGKKSGQRAIQKVINKLVSSGEYELLHTFRTPGPELPVSVWGRIR